jgi:hypothetical protein
MRTRIWRVHVAGLPMFVALFDGHPAGAQATRGTIQGAVADSSGSSVPGRRPNFAMLPPA